VRIFAILAILAILAVLAVLAVLADRCADCIGKWAGASLLQNDGLIAILGLQRNQVAPDALLDLVLYLFGQRRVAIDVLAERLSVLRRRRQSLSLRKGFICLAGSGFRRVSPRRRGCGFLVELVRVCGEVRYWRRQLLPV
jgi:hypothetical protein